MNENNIPEDYYRKTVERLLEERTISIKELSAQSGVGESVLKKLSSGRQTIDNTNFKDVEKLFKYALKQEI